MYKSLYFDYYFVSLQQNFEVMSIEELEKSLLNLQKKEGQPYSNLKSSGITYDVARRIQQGKNYRFEAMFLYLDGLGYLLVMNGEVMMDIASLGNALTLLRENKKVSWAKIQKESGLCSQQVRAIEHGENYTRSSLLKYLKFVDASFDVKSMVEYYNLDK